MLPSAPLKLIVGLGNPGRRYAHTYHNVGMRAVDDLARKYGAEKNGFAAHRSLFVSRRVGHLILVKPLTFMNDSGRAVTAALAFFKIKPAELLVLHDESDLPLGAWKLSFGRGAAGHRGIESIVNQLGTKEFSRLRIGIRKGPQKTKAGAFVLRRVSHADLKILYGVFGATTEKLMENESPPGVGRISARGSVTD